MGQKIEESNPLRLFADLGEDLFELVNKENYSLFTSFSEGDLAPASKNRGILSVTVVKVHKSSK